jgi:ketosteroid isomerase-like protein
MESNVEIYESILEAFNRDGVDGVAPFFADDVEVYDPDLPNRSYRGPVAARHAAEMLTSGFEKIEIREFRLVPAGNRVVALVTAHGKAERDDLEVETREGHTVTFRDRQGRPLAGLSRPGRGAQRGRTRSGARHRRPALAADLPTLRGWQPRSASGCPCSPPSR